jgi:hypothetical protein
VIIFFDASNTSIDFISNYALEVKSKFCGLCHFKITSHLTPAAIALFLKPYYFSNILPNKRLR